MPQLLSIQVGKPAMHGGDGISKKLWTSGIFKTTVTGAVFLDTLNLDGDGQADLDNHGGAFRPVLMYSAAHYPYWRETLARPDFPYGAFGENFTVTDLDEDTVALGDQFRLGDVVLEVTQPRMPCWKLARKWNIKDLAAQVDATGFGGWYVRVLQTGMVEAGMTLERIAQPHPDYTIRRVTEQIRRADDRPLMLALSALEMLTPSWREWFAEQAA